MVGWGTDYSRGRSGYKERTREQAAALGQGRETDALDSLCGRENGERWTDLKEFIKNTEQTDQFNEESQ